MTDDKVVSIKTRRSLADTEKALQAEAAEEKKVRDEAFQETKKLTLEILDNIRARVESEECGGLLVVTQNMETRMFVHDLLISHETVPRERLPEWSGIVNALNAELTQAVFMTPIMSADGTITDPYDEPEEYDD